MKIKILHWNIWYLEKAENVLNFLKKTNADIICLQELTTQSNENPNLDIPKLLANKLKLNYFYKEAQSWDLKDNKRKIGDGIFTKLPIVGTNYRFINKKSSNPTVFGKEGRVYIEISVKVNSSNFTVGTAHMSGFPMFKVTNSKKIESDKLIQILKNKKSNFVFTGDLNSLPDSYTVKRISDYLINAGPKTSLKTFASRKLEPGKFNASVPEHRVDYVFCTKDLKIISSKIGDTKYSDHLPILAEFNI